MESFTRRNNTLAMCGYLEVEMHFYREAFDILTQKDI